MRKLILISAFVLAAVSAQAGDGRSLILAANDAPAAATTTTTSTATKPEEAKADVKADVKTEAAKPEASSKQASRSKKTLARREGDEAKARRIAARYGVYW